MFRDTGGEEFEGQSNTTGSTPTGGDLQREIDRLRQEQDEATVELAQLQSQRESEVEAGRNIDKERIKLRDDISVQTGEEARLVALLKDVRIRKAKLDEQLKEADKTFEGHAKIVRQLGPQIGEKEELVSHLGGELQRAIDEQAAGAGRVGEELAAEVERKKQLEEEERKRAERAKENAERAEDRQRKQAALTAWRTQDNSAPCPDPTPSTFFTGGDAEKLNQHQVAYDLLKKFVNLILNRAEREEYELMDNPELASGFFLMLFKVFPKAFESTELTSLMNGACGILTTQRVSQIRLNYTLTQVANLARACTRLIEDKSLNEKFQRVVTSYQQLGQQKEEQSRRSILARSVRDFGEDTDVRPTALEIYFNPALALKPKRSDRFGQQGGHHSQEELSDLTMTTTAVQRVGGEPESGGRGMRKENYREGPGAFRNNNAEEGTPSASPHPFSRQSNFASPAAEGAGRGAGRGGNAYNSATPHSQQPTNFLAAPLPYGHGQGLGGEGSRVRVVDESQQQHQQQVQRVSSQLKPAAGRGGKQQ